MRSSHISLTVFGILALMACQTHDTIPMPETEFRTLADFEIASDIAEQCHSLELNKTRKQIDDDVDEALNAKGLSPEEISYKKRRAAAQWEPTYKATYENVVPVPKDSVNYYCKYGQYEIDRHSAVGLLLESS